MKEHDIIESFYSILLKASPGINNVFVCFFLIIIAYFFEV